MGSVLSVLRRVFGLYGEMSLQDFFLPEGSVVPEGKSAIPKRLQINMEYARFANKNGPEEEIVYDLETARYPFKVHLVEGLPERMMMQLKQIVGKGVVSPSMLIAWNLIEALKKVSGKSDVDMLADAFWYLVTEAFCILHPDIECKIEHGTMSRDERTAVDIQIKLGAEAVILTNVMEPTISDVYTSQLVELASGDGASVFEGELPEKFIGPAAILAKVCNYLSSYTKVEAH
jgi:hypothetical protein